MHSPPQNSDIGQRNSRAARSAKSKDRSLGVFEDIQFVAIRDRPKTLADYARIFNAEGRPTVSGKGEWSVPMMQRYMKMFSISAKKLLADNPVSSGIGVGYPPEIYAALRSEMMRLNTISDGNGVWVSALEADPHHGQPVFHTVHGHGDFLEQLSLTSLRCGFVVLDQQGEFVSVKHKCRPADLKLFVFHMSAEERRQVAADFWRRLTAHQEGGGRYLTNGWHL